jgi:hypothetical protein
MCYLYMVNTALLLCVYNVQVNKLQAELDTAGAASSALLLKLDGLERENKRLRDEVHHCYHCYCYCCYCYCCCCTVAQLRTVAQCCARLRALCCVTATACSSAV